MLIAPADRPDFLEESRFQSQPGQYDDARLGVSSISLTGAGAHRSAMKVGVPSVCGA